MTPEQSHGLFVELTEKKDPNTQLSMADTMTSDELRMMKKGWEALRSHSIGILGFHNYLAYMALEARKKVPGKVRFKVDLEILPDISVNITRPMLELIDSKNTPLATMKKRWGQKSATQTMKGYKK